MRSFTIRRACLSAALAALVGTAVALPAQAQDAFPSKPSTLIVPIPAGGSTDRHLRAIAAEAS